MPYVIAEPCTDVMDKSCMDVCPVDCIQPGQDDDRNGTTSQLFINPDECIDCDACRSACPVGAPFPLDMLPPEWKHYAEINREFFED